MGGHDVTADDERPRHVSYVRSLRSLRYALRVMVRVLALSAVVHPPGEALHAGIPRRNSLSEFPRSHASRQMSHLGRLDDA